MKQRRRNTIVSILITLSVVMGVLLIGIPNGRPVFALSAGVSSQKNTYLLGETVNLATYISFDQNDKPTSLTPTLSISGPQTLTADLPVLPGSYDYPDKKLRVEVTYPTGYGYGYGYFNGASRIDYTLHWAPPAFKDPAPQFKVIPDKAEAFSVPILPQPAPPATGGAALLPDSTLSFDIPAIPPPAAEPGAPPELNQTVEAFDIPAVPVPGLPEGAPASLPTTTEVFSVPTATVPTAPEGVPELPSSSKVFDIAAAQVPRALAYDGTDFWVVVDGTPVDHIMKVDSSGTVLASLNAPSSNVEAITYLNNFLWVADNNYPQQIHKLDPFTGTVLTSYSPPENTDVGAMETDGNNLLLASKTWDRIWKVSQAGTLLESKYVSSWSGATGLAVKSGDTENWYAAKGNKIYKIRRSSAQVVSSWTTSPSREDIQGIVFVDETLYFVDTGTTAVYKTWVPSGIEVTQDVRGLAYGGTFLWAVVDGTPKDKILKINLTDGSLATSFDAPNDGIEDITYVGSYLYVISQPSGQSAEIKKLSPTDGAEVTSFSTPGPGWQMRGLGTDGTDLLMSSKDGRDIYKVSTSGTLKTQGWDWNGPKSDYIDLSYKSGSKQIFGAKDDTVMRFSGTSPFPYQTKYVTTLADIQGLVFIGDTIYIADNETHKIYKASIPSDISITTEPKGLTYDGTNLWILVDGTPNDEILKVNVTDGSLVAHFSAPSSNCEGLAFLNSYLWVADNASGTRTIQKVDPATGNIADSFSAGVWNDMRAITEYGTKLLITLKDTKSMYVRSTTGSDQGDIGDWNSPLNGYTGLAYNADRGIFGANGNKIVRFSASGGGGSYQQQWTVTPDDIQGLTFIGNYLYIADITTKKIYKTSVPSGITYTTDPVGMAYDGTNLWIVVDGTPTDMLLKVNKDTGALLAYYNAPNAGIEDITYLGGYLYLLSCPSGGSNEVKKIDPSDGSEKASWGTPNNWSMASLGNDGTQLLRSDKNGNQIYRQSVSGTHSFTQINTWGIPFWPYSDLTYRSAKQEIFVTKESKIARIDNTSGQSMEQWTTTCVDIQGLSFVGDIIYIADGADSKIYRTAIPLPVVTITTEPKGLATDGTNLYLIVDGSPRDKVIKVSTTGTVLASFDAPGDNVNAITYHSGALYVAVNDTQPGGYGTQPKIKKIDKDDGKVLDEWQSPSNQELHALASDGTSLYAGSKWTNDWFIINPTTQGFTQKWGINLMSYPSPNGWSAMTWGTLYGAKGTQLFKININGDMQNSWFLSSGVDIKGLALIGIDLYIADKSSEKVFKSTIPGNPPELTNAGDYTATLNVIADSKTASSAPAFFSLTKITQVEVNITSPTVEQPFNSSPITVAGSVNDPSIKSVYMTVGLPVAKLVDDNMESGEKTWKKSGLWNLANKGKAHSGQWAWYYGKVSQMNYDTGPNPNDGNLMIESVTIGEGSFLNFWTWYNTEPGPAYDKKLVQVYGSIGGTTQWWNVCQIIDWVSPGTPQPDSSASNFFWAQIPLSHYEFGGAGPGPSAIWDQVQVDLSPFAGQTVNIRFRFNTVDGAVNNQEGWYIDDILVKGASTTGMALSVSDDMTFTGSASIVEGMNTIFVKAINPYTTPLLTDEGSVQVSLDTTAPQVYIQPVQSPTKIPAQTITVTYEELNWELFTLEVENAAGEKVVASIKQKPQGNSVEQAVYLLEGDNIITATLTDAFGGSTSASSNIKLDTSGPTIQVLSALYPIGELSARPGHSEGDPVIFQVDTTDIGSGVTAVAMLLPTDSGQPAGLTQQQQSDLNAGKVIQVGESYYKKVSWVTKELVWFWSAGEVPAAVRDQWGTTGAYIMMFSLPAGTPPGAYNLSIVAMDGAGNESFSTISGQVVSTLSAYNIYLMPKWNFISLPLIPDKTLYQAEVGKTQIKKITENTNSLVKVWYYDASYYDDSTSPPTKGKWYVYNTDPAVPSDLTELDTGKGYWFYTDPATFKMSPPLAEGLPQTPAPIKFSYVGVVLEPAKVPPSYPLKQGWNAVGFHSEWPRLVSDALASVMEPRLWGSLWQYDNYIRFEKNQPPDIILGGFRSLSTTDKMNPGKGYWIFMKSDGTLAP